jgi:hypothetical protein
MLIGHWKAAPPAGPSFCCPDAACASQRIGDGSITCDWPCSGPGFLSRDPMMSGALLPGLESAVDLLQFPRQTRCRNLARDLVDQVAEFMGFNPCSLLRPEIRSNVNIPARLAGFGVGFLPKAAELAHRSHCAFSLIFALPISSTRGPYALDGIL